MIRKTLDLVLSPYFDFEKQVIKDPPHMQELIAEIRFNTRIPQFESELLAKRLEGQKNLKPYTKEEQTETFQQIIRENRRIETPEYQEVFLLIEEIAEKLYLFISRDEIWFQSKLGILGTFLSNLVAKDIQNIKNNISKKRW